MDCILSPEWSEWSECDARCGPGTSQRRRQVLQPALNGGAACGPTLQKIPCEGSNCKVARAPDGFHELRGTPPAFTMIRTFKPDVEWASHPA